MVDVINLYRDFSHLQARFSFLTCYIPLSSQRINSRNASKHWIKDNMKQMTETMDAIEQINDNMDRDLHSSRMVRKLT